MLIHNKTMLICLIAIMYCKADSIFFSNGLQFWIGVAARSGNGDSTSFQTVLNNNLGTDYRNFGSPIQTASGKNGVALVAANGYQWQGFFQNDLKPYICEKYPAATGRYVL